MTNFLTSQEMQAMINVDRSTVYRMAEDGRLPAVKVGRQWRFPSDRVAELLGVRPARDDSRAEPTSGGVRPLEQLLVPEVAQSIADLIGDTFGVMAVITDMHGRPLTVVANPCGYYASIADHPGAADACLTEWRQFAAEPHVAPRFVRTHLGFLCARTFVWVDLRPVGMIVVGGVKPSVWPPPPEQVRALADELGVPADGVLAAVDLTWELDDDQRRRLLRLLPQFGDLVSQLAAARNHVSDRPERTTPDADAYAARRPSHSRPQKGTQP
jgi:excisionase family DNA binding protein